jgi:hypothetical protein
MFAENGCHFEIQYEGHISTRSTQLDTVFISVMFVMITKYVLGKSNQNVYKFNMYDSG